MCAVSSPLSPLTATSPLHHRRADQIGTGPSNSVLDKWKVAASEDLQDWLPKLKLNGVVPYCDHMVYSL